MPILPLGSALQDRYFVLVLTNQFPVPETKHQDNKEGLKIKDSFFISIRTDGVVVRQL